MMRLLGSDIAAERGDDVLFSHLDFSVLTGQLMIVTGPNGSGKSTLLRIIAGLLPPLAGSVVAEVENKFFPPAVFSHYLSTENAMKPSLSVLENLAFWAHFFDDALATPQEALNRVGLSHVADLPFRVLSTGQKRRVALARLVINYRPIWLLDEPTSGLDESARDLVTALMREHLGNGGLIVAATHLPLGLQGDCHFNIGDFCQNLEVAAR